MKDYSMQARRIQNSPAEDIWENQNPAWAEGLPLGSAGYIGERFYFKD